MTTDVRYHLHPEAARQAGSDELRRNFLVEDIFVPGQVQLTYSHADRMVVGGAMPGDTPLDLVAPAPFGVPGFVDRRELAIVSIGGPARVSVAGKDHPLDRLDTLYVGLGAGEVRLAGTDAGNPAKLYLVSTPAHAAHPVRHVAWGAGRSFDRGTAEEGNMRTICQVVHPAVCPSCQLTLGITLLKPANFWNTMPAHTHDRRSEAYLYFDLPPEARIFHFMGEPQHTRHMVVANEQAILSPGWSIHSGVGTSSYGFVWAMAGDNVEFDDMDMVPMEALR
jgi:4-deoxy-L-threo-5-hexosulose-uronate ketol-isomerase